MTARFLLGALIGAQALPAGAYPRPGRTELVSVGEAPAEAFSSAPSVSSDGRFVVFTSFAANLAPGDTNETGDVFVRDLAAGTVERVSVSTAGTEGNGGSVAPRLSSDGRFVAFTSAASTLVAGDTNGFPDVFVRDREMGTTERVSLGEDGTQGNGASAGPAISGDGRYIAFFSAASNLVPDDTNTTYDVFVRDRANGETHRASVSSEGAEGNGASSFPAFSGDGRTVAFASEAATLVAGDDNAVSDVFVHDLETGATERVSAIEEETLLHGFSGFPSLSGDGRFVAFQAGSNLVPGDLNRAFDVFVHDRERGSMERVSVAADGAEGNSYSGLPSISADGRFVAFQSNASNLVPDDAYPLWDVFVRDRMLGITERVSVSHDGSVETGQSIAPSIAGDGRLVAYQSDAANLVPADGNGVGDVFVRDRGAAVGVGDLSVGDDGRSVSGWATFSGTVVASAADPAGDGTLGGQDVGADLTRAVVVYRPEVEDLLVRLDLASLPLPTGLPGIVYGIRARTGGVAYEVRALAAGATTVPPAAPYFALHRCTPDCAEVARLNGGIGTAGTGILVSVPLSLLAPGELTEITAYTSAGEAVSGGLHAIDDVALPDVAIAEPKVLLGVATAGTPEHEVPFEAQLHLQEGWFTGSVDAVSPPAGERDVWARACLGELCGSALFPRG